MGVRRAGEAKWAFAPRLEIGIKNLIFLEKPEVGIFIRINWFDSCCRCNTHIAQEPSSLFWCHAVMCLRFTHVPSFACRGGLRKSWADCPTVGLYCATINGNKSVKVHFMLRWQAFCCMRLLNADILTGNAARSDMLIAVGYVHLNFVKRSMSESIAMLP